MSELVLKESVAVAALLEVPLHLLRHLQSFFREMPELLLEDHESIVHDSLMLTQSLHNAIELPVIALEVVIPPHDAPLQGMYLLLQSVHRQADFGYTQFVLGFLCGNRPTEVARCELVSCKSLRTYLIYFYRLCFSCSKRKSSLACYLIVLVSATMLENSASILAGRGRTFL